MLGKQNKAFTLFEIIIVLIILGILAGISIPALFSQIQRQRGQEAVNTLSIIRSAMETCGTANNYDFYTYCGTFDNIDISDPSYNASTNSGAKFTYSITVYNSDPNYNYLLTATDSNSNYIKYYRWLDAKITCDTSSIYQGIC